MGQSKSREPGGERARCHEHAAVETLKRSRSSLSFVESLSHNWSTVRSFFTLGRAKKKRVVECSQQEEEEPALFTMGDKYSVCASTEVQVLEAIAGDSALQEDAPAVKEESAEQLVAQALAVVDISKDDRGDPGLEFPFLVDDATIAWMTKEDARVMLIMRGLPGSGKSTVVKEVLRVHDGAVVCSADDYFVQEDGEYKFDQSLLKEAHNASQQKAVEACERGVRVVVVDNTNVLRWEMGSYFKTANIRGYRVVLAEPKTPWRMDPKELAERNSHNVPEETIRKRLGEFQVVIPTYYAWFLSTRDSKALSSYGRRFLVRCLEQCADFRHDFEAICCKVDDALNYYNRDACVHSSRQILHCTAKFCGKNGGNDYAALAVVGDNLGKVSTLSVIGFVFTKDTLGARVMLDSDQLELWGQDDEEKFEIDRCGGSGQLTPRKSGEGKGQNKKGSSASPSASSRRRSEDLFDPELASSVREDAYEVSNRFMPVASKGRRAHLTLGTAGRVGMVTTGLDVLEACRAEAMTQQGELEPLTFDLENGSLRRYSQELWVLYLERRAIFDAIFTGFY